MKRLIPVAILCAVSLIAGGILAAGPDPLPWAYNVVPTIVPAPPPIVDDGTLRHLPGNNLGFTLTQIRNPFGPADWYPGDHPPMPDVVAHGRAPDVRACGLCHYPNGKGRQENAGISDLPVAYFLQQLADFRSGARKSTEPRKANVTTMINIAKGMTDDDMKSAAEYFATMKWTPWIKVVETDAVPENHVQGGMFIRVEGSNKTEPIGDRIVEMPDNAEATELLRDPRSPFTAYVPVGSLKKGESLATTGNAGKTLQCTICHGPDMRGLGPIPRLAGKSPSYIARQLVDFKSGSRNGTGAQLMKPVVAQLTDEDILNLSAYLASLAP